jgi:hypothetical protein
MPSMITRMSLLNEAADIYGYEDVDEMLQAATFDSVAPAICTRGCGATEDLEPDGYCRCECGGKIQSVLLIAGMI